MAIPKTDEAGIRQLKLLRSRNGSVFGAKVEVENDGTLVILSNDGAGYRSAHRDCAQKYYGTRPTCDARLTWVNLRGVRVVLTRWIKEA